MLTAIVTNRNYARFLPRCIDSALSQGCEVIVIDNASTDGSQAVMESYGEKIRAVYHETDSGSCTLGMNEGMALATGEWFMFLDADDHLLPLGAEALTSVDADWVVGDIAVVDDDGALLDVWCYAGFPHDRESARTFAREHLTLPVSMKGAFRTAWARENHLTRSEWETVGYAEDVRSCLDWLERDPRIGYVPRFTLAYHYNAGNMNDSISRALMQRELQEYLGDE